MSEAKKEQDHKEVEMMQAILVGVKRKLWKRNT